MSTNTATKPRTIHTGCLVTDRGNGFGRCEIHHVRVYRDGIDWHVMDRYYGGTIAVLDDDHGRQSANHRVTLTCPAGASDDELLEVAGWHARGYFGYSVTRYSDGTALVSMHLD